MGYNLYLDDSRDPIDSAFYTGNILYSTLTWTVVRNYDEFVKIITERGVPDAISFDHDLGQEFEIWKDIDEYVGIYKVSSLGRIIRTQKTKGTKGNNILTPIKNESGLYVHLYNKGNNKRFKIHRLVGKSFLLNPENKPEINHKDGNRWNNNVDNLEWATSSENNTHSHRELERKFTAYGEHHNNSLTISQYNKKNELVDVYGSVNEAGRQLKICFSNIAKCARGERKYSGGYIWKYENKLPTKKSEIIYISKDDKNYSERFFIPDPFIEKTGYHCAKWLIYYCIDNHKELPQVILIHSMNPAGSINIKSLFDTYLKMFRIEHSAINLPPARPARR
jgi:hypothetical protein